MKFKFSTQDYQTEAVNSTVKIFNGQPKISPVKFDADLGNLLENSGQIDTIREQELYQLSTGFRNEDIHLTDKMLLDNVNKIQMENDIPMTNKLIKGKQGVPIFDIEMETGTGKTYVYIKTMFELNEKYGWNKYIIVVPSIAIREGVAKSFEMTEEHFMTDYNKKARFFIYDSNNLGELDQFSSSNDINVMIINIQAFNTSMKEGAKNQYARKIYSERDEFGSRRPIDVISANRPILIMDEPQKMGGSKTQDALKNFNPLFILNYSATHKESHNLVYVLDSLDAYNKKLVKGIQVKGFNIKNLRGTDSYLYLDEILIDPKKPPRARIQLEVQYSGGVKRENRIFNERDSLYTASNNMEQYKGFVVSEINPLNNVVNFTNGDDLYRGDVVGDVHEETIRRIQIRETIKSHFEKEMDLFNEGIKTLSLFFIDEVSKYRQYEEGEPILGEYGRIFEEEYKSIYSMMKENFSPEYIDYLESINVESTHNGYFSVDKKGQLVNSKTKRGEDSSDDISAYDLILKDKERLLSFKEPTRFIFSHSALREGWDNPNIFQICTLKTSGTEISRRQEVGRGLRISVNEHGERMDVSRLSESFHDINKLTVVASEGYATFVDGLQKEMAENLANRPTRASIDFFSNAYIRPEGENKRVLSKSEARAIYQYLIKQDYIDEDDKLSESFKSDVENDTLEEFPDSIKNIQKEVMVLFNNLLNNNNPIPIEPPSSIIPENKLNKNFYKKEFQNLWNLINNKYSYKVDFDSEELIYNSIKNINEKLSVSKVFYVITKGGLKEQFNKNELINQTVDVSEETEIIDLNYELHTDVKYDLIGKISEKTMLTRKTIVRILKGIEEKKFDMFKINPEEFISKVSTLIDEQKGSIIVQHITYHKTSEKYDENIFTDGHSSKRYSDAYKGKKHIQDYVITDGISKNSVERKFVEEIDLAKEVAVYAKLPSGFKIPTPVGSYNPDWAIAFEEGSVKHIYFVAETKGSLSSLELRGIENTKINCAKKLFDNLSDKKIKYDVVTDYKSLLDVMTK